jgi:hypothetical protein
MGQGITHFHFFLGLGNCRVAVESRQNFSRDRCYCATNLPFDAKHVKVNDQRWSWLGSCVSPSC